MNRDRSELQALRISEIRSSITEFSLYLDTGNDIIPYATSRHQWSLPERMKLVQNGQFVILYARQDQERVRQHLTSTAEEPWPYRGKEASVQFLIADGIAEFIKTRYCFPFQKNHFEIFQGLVQRLYQYLSQHSRLHELLWQLTQHDTHTFYHAARVAAYAVGTASFLEVSKSTRLWELALGAFLHDMGHLSVDSSLLKCPGPLLRKDWYQIERHPDETLRLLSQVSLNPYVLELAIHHHERMDGSGYPHRLAGAELPLDVRLLSFVEVFTALTSPRPYQAPSSSNKAIKFMQEKLSQRIDLSLVEPFQALLGYAKAERSQLKAQEVLSASLAIV